MKYRMLTTEQLDAIQRFAEERGRCWKADLRLGWERARWAGPLQSLRNSHGPAWLAHYTLPRAKPAPEPAIEVLTQTGGQFHTGRCYGAPQVIAWEVVRVYPDPDLWRASVRFYDDVRGIVGFVVVVLLSGQDVNELERQVLADYDAGRYALSAPE